MEQEQFDIQDYVAILKRRIWAFMIPVVLIVAIAVPVIFMLPPKFESKATVLIEDQAIPSDLVRSTVNTFAAERLEVITQRVLTTQNLVALINKLDLYRDRRSSQTMTELAERVRKNFKMKLVDAKVKDSRSGRASQATIAFTLSFEHNKARTAQAVVNELVSLYISENLKTRRAKAEETKEFLQQEVNKAAEQISTLEEAIARFKQQHASNLPEQMDITRGALQRAEQQVLTIQRRIDVLRERKIYLEAQLVQVNPFLKRPTTSTAKDALDPEDRLRKLQSELIRLRARYGPRHPDVIRKVREIKAVSKEISKTPSQKDKVSLIREQLAAAKKELATARKRYSEAHPDVGRLKRRIAQLEKSLKDSDDAKPVPSSDKKKIPDNPAFIKLKADLAAADAEIKSLLKQGKALDARIKALESQVRSAPEVERAYTLLKRKLAFAITTHRELSDKLRQARLGEVLERERKAERFSLLEPANLASEPISPNRPAYVMVAFIFAFAFGAASAVGREAMDKSVHSPKQLTALTGAAPLVVLPEILSETKQRRRRWIRLGIPLLFVLALGVGAYLIFVAEILGPWDVLQARIENKISPWLRDLGLN